MEFGLIGEKLGHSYSPIIHQQLAPYRYELLELSRQELDGFLAKREFQGLNVTIPYKKDVIPHCAELSDAAREIGSVNTLITRPDGSLYGHNTDLDGLIYMLESAGIDPEGKKAVILGSGGTSLTAQAALRHLNAREIIVVSRSGPVRYEDLYALHQDAEILINTTPVGMYPKTGVSPVDLNRLPNLCGIADVIYNPEKTALLLDAQTRGIPCVSGLSMLVSQAWKAAELFSASSIPAQRVEEICRDIRFQTLNLVLVGMPGCGKSSVGQSVAQLLGRPFADCDEVLVQRAGMSIPDIFSKYGEPYFRDLESQVLEDLCKKGGQVIATGGGAVMRPQNIRSMRQNSRVAFLRRPLENLPRNGRPLSSSEDAVRLLWEKRKDLYAACADITLDNTSSPESIAQELKEAFYEAAGH